MNNIELRPEIDEILDYINASDEEYNKKIKDIEENILADEIKFEKEQKKIDEHFSMLFIEENTQFFINLTKDNDKSIHEGIQNIETSNK